MRRAPAALLLLPLLLSACTGGDEEPTSALPAPSLTGACAPLQDDLADLAALSPDLSGPGELADATAAELQLTQSGLQATAPELPLEVSAAVDRLITRIGLVRIASDAGRLEAAEEAGLREAYDGVLSACDGL